MPDATGCPEFFQFGGRHGVMLLVDNRVAVKSDSLRHPNLDRQWMLRPPCALEHDLDGVFSAVLRFDGVAVRDFPEDFAPILDHERMDG